MNKAEEFNIVAKFNIRSKPFKIKGERYYSEDALKLYAHRYHQSEVNAISDEVNIQIKVANDCGYPKGEIDILKWFKKKLLKK